LVGTPEVRRGAGTWPPAPARRWRGPEHSRPASRARPGRQAILVANAGVGRKLAWDDEALDLEAWDEAMAVNLRAPWLLTRAVLPDMLERNFGRLLYVSSVAALNGGVVGPHYAASKAGLLGLMHHLAGRGVTVNTVGPSPHRRYPHVAR
jgi:3-oxoacyl-[acyl-carrier protein] reductase